jgi:hypothetical protein
MLQVFMLLFGLVCIAFAVYGMVTVDRAVADKGFAVLVTVTNYVVRVFDHLDKLLGSADEVSSIIDDFQAIVTNQINVTGFNHYLTVGTVTSSSC